MELFGLEITKVKKQEELSGQIALPIDDEGALVANAASYYGVYLDQDGAAKNEHLAIQKYREISLYPEVDIAIQDIVNEAIPQESDSPQLEMVLDELDYSDELKATLNKEFANVLKLLDYESQSADLFRRWYIDGRLAHQIIVDKNNLKRGIVKLVMLDSAKIKKMRDIKKERTTQGVDVVGDVEEYFLYSERGFSGTSLNGQGVQQQMSGIKLSPDTIIYTPSGFIDQANNSVLSYLQKAIRPANQLRMLEDSTVVYFIARAPERRIFYIDIENLPKAKGEQYVKDIMNKYRNKMVYDSASGQVKDEKKYTSMLEDLWIPRRGTKGTEITTLPGASNQQSMLDNVTYFQKKLYQSLNIPVSRLQGDSGFSLGRTTEISRDELKFQKFIDRLRKKFIDLVYDVLKVQLILKGVLNNVEWDHIKQDIMFRFQSDNYFTELKAQDLINSRLVALQGVNQYLGIYYSKEWVMKNILKMTDEDIEEMESQIKNEADDETATIWGQQQKMQPPMPPMDPNMGQDPNADPNAQIDPNVDPNAQQDPNADPNAQIDPNTGQPVQQQRNPFA